MKLKIKNKDVLFDKVFLPFIKEHSWHIDNYGYVVTTLWCPKKKKTGERVKMHRFVSGFPSGRVDHINGNRLDNRLINLREVSHAQNLWNGRISKNNKAGFKGVVLDKRRGQYKAEICKNRKRYYLGQFKTKEEAALAYNEAAKILFGEYALLNEVVK